MNCAASNFTLSHLPSLSASSEAAKSEKITTPSSTQTTQSAVSTVFNQVVQRFSTSSSSSSSSSKRSVQFSSILPECEKKEGESKNFIKQAAEYTLNGKNCRPRDIEEMIEEYPHLERLTIDVGMLQDSSLDLLKQLSKLSKLSLCSPHITKDVFAYLKNIPRLKSLCLFNCQSIKKPEASSLAAMKLLERLEIDNCSGIHTPDLVSLFLSFPHLGSLKLRIMPCPKEVCSAISLMDKLKMVVIDRCAGFSEECFTLICALSSLTHLYMDSQNVTFISGLQQVTNSANMQVIVLNNCVNWTDECTRLLLKCPLLERLAFSGCANLSDKSLELLVELENLKSLDLENCPLITDKGLAFLEKSASLRELQLTYSCKMSDEVLLRFKTKKNFSLQVEGWNQKT